MRWRDVGAYFFPFLTLGCGLTVGISAQFLCTSITDRGRVAPPPSIVVVAQTDKDNQAQPLVV